MGQKWNRPEKKNFRHKYHEKELNSELWSFGDGFDMACDLWEKHLKQKQWYKFWVK